MLLLLKSFNRKPNGIYRNIKFTVIRPPLRESAAVEVDFGQHSAISAIEITIAAPFGISGIFVGNTFVF